MVTDYDPERLAAFTHHGGALSYAYKMARQEAEEAGESLVDYWNEMRSTLTGRYVRGNGTEGYYVARVPLNPPSQKEATP